MKWNNVNDSLPEYDKCTGKNLVDLFEVKTSNGLHSFAYYGVGGWCTNLSWYEEYMINDVTHWRKLVNRYEEA